MFFSAMFKSYSVLAVHPRHCLRQSNHTFELTNSNSPRCFSNTCREKKKLKLMLSYRLNLINNIHICHKSQNRMKQVQFSIILTTTGVIRLAKEIM